MARLPKKPAPRPKAERYHHGDLPRAMLSEALRTIQRRGIDSLTLRSVGEKLGVSRTALYRHFANKEALLGAVAAEGFRRLRQELFEAWDQGGRGRAGFEAMGAAYIHFAVRHPSHYRVMFGGALAKGDVALPPQDKSADAFGVLVDALVELQGAGLAVSQDAHLLALFVWSVVHGVAMLALDGVLHRPEDTETLSRFAIERLWSGIGVGMPAEAVK
jgi:AcrR family transcriptional regulator